MSNTVSLNRLRKAPIASACFMGLGQVLFLKQYLRGFILMAFEIILILSHSHIYKSLKGLVTLGDPHPELPVKLRDHSIFMMVNGLIVIIILAHRLRSDRTDVRQPRLRLHDPSHGRTNELHRRTRW